MSCLLAGTSVVAGLAGAGTAAAHPEPETRLEVRYSIGPFAMPAGEFVEPEGIAVAPDGAVLLADRANHRVQRFTSKGELVGIWGGYGALPGQLIHPTAVATDSAGNVFVVDSGNRRVQKLSPGGLFLGEWHAPSDLCPAKAGCNLWGAAVASDGAIYVSMAPAEVGLVRLAANLSSHAAWPPRGSDLIAPRGLAVDADNSLFVSDFADNRVYHFDAQGNLLAAWGATGVGPGQLLGPAGIALAPADEDEVGGDVGNAVGGDVGNAVGGGTVLVADSGSGKVKRFTPDGRHLEDAAGVSAELDRPADVAVGPSGQLYVADTGNNLLRGYEEASLVSSWGGGQRLFQRPSGVEVSLDTVYVTLSDPAQVARFSRLGQPREAWALDTGLIEPTDVAAAGDLFVADPAAAAILRFNTAGVFVGRVAAPGGENWLAPTSLAESGGDLLVADGAAGRVTRIPLSSGGTADSFGSGRLVWPVGVDAGGDGDVYVADRDGGRVARFGADGVERTSWRPRGLDLEAPSAVAVDGADTLFVTDSPGMWAVESGADAHVVLPAGVGPGQLLGATGVATDESGRVFVADTENHRIQVASTQPLEGWRAEVFANPWFAGPAVLVRALTTPQFDPAVDGPIPGSQPNPGADSGHSVRMTGLVDLLPGTYRLTLETSGGARLWLGDRLVVDSPDRAGTAKLVVPVGTNVHWQAVLEHSARDGGRVGLRWERIGDVTTLFLPRLDDRAAMK